ncbi:dual specificity tyrosine-phosphorylation-regulated kinase 2-like [Salvelinus sp. IW2-2015]|uniref:dual specificity tyrosine-phosphorylation-regulated kinase 2-like n=1 Tax=Salvelinus sp. IW2-2015 TaxID=2691554 RepID=UPI0038D432C0
MMVLQRKAEGPITAARHGDGLYNSYMRTDHLLKEEADTHSPAGLPPIPKHTHLLIILWFHQVYFLGPNAKKRPAVAGGNNNGGFDDEQGGYIHVPHDHLAFRYEFLKVIGKGSFGQVTLVIDFGSSCFHHQRVYTYIQSRFYRAPEVILGSRYGLPIDMWSFGCILAELLTGYPMFPGEDEGDQLACVMELLGMPPTKLLEQAKRAKNFISSKGHPRYCGANTLPSGATVFTGSRSRRGKLRGPPASKEWSAALKGCEDLTFTDFIKRCLDWDPSSRLTPSQALRHPWLYRRLPKPLASAVGEKKGATEHHSTSLPSILPAKGVSGTAANPNKLRANVMGDSAGSIPLRTVLPKLVS